MTSKIRSEIEKATDVKAQGADETAQKYYKHLAKAVQDLGDKDFDALSKGAQDWFNGACDAADKKEDIPEFSDEVKEDAPRRRRAAADEDEPKTVAYEPKKGDKVKVTSKRGKDFEGTFVEFEDGRVIIDDGKEELDVCAQDGAVIVSLEAPKASGRRRAAEDDEPTGPVEPKVGDTLECTNKRGKIYVGILIEETDSDLVLKLVDGSEEELAKDRLDKVVVKHSPKAEASDGDRQATRRGAIAEKDEPASDKGGASDKAKKVTKEDNGGVSVTQRTKELVIDNQDASVEKIGAMLKKEGLTYRDVTMELNYKEAHKFLKMLADRKMLK